MPRETGSENDKPCPSKLDPMSIRVFVHCIYWLVLFLKRTQESRNRSNGSIINHKIKTLIVTFMPLFNYLDTLPKLDPLLFSGLEHQGRK